jgi:hypothetical protein
MYNKFIRRDVEIMIVMFSGLYWESVEGFWDYRVGEFPGFFIEL